MLMVQRPVWAHGFTPSAHSTVFLLDFIELYSEMVSCVKQVVYCCYYYCYVIVVVITHLNASLSTLMIQALTSFISFLILCAVPSLPSWFCPGSILVLSWFCGGSLQEGHVFVCGVNYREEDFMIREEEEVRGWTATLTLDSHTARFRELPSLHQ